MKVKLSLLMITKNAEELIEKSLKSVKGLVDEIVVIDNFSTDETVNIAKKYGAKIFLHKEEDLGKQRAYGLIKVTGEWVLALDSDEIVSEKLRNEISSRVNRDQISNFSAFNIPFQNHFLGRPISHGGEDYKKLILFRKDTVKIEPAFVHEKFEVKRGVVRNLKNKIYHYSYHSLWQVFKKFTDYGIREAKQKSTDGEKTSLKKIFLYPIHMFWARFVKDKGYKDGIFRIPLDLGFAWMEFLTYFLLMFL